MRVLSMPTSDLPALTPLGHGAANSNANSNKETVTISASNVLKTGVSIPTVVLDADVVSDHMAARLCTSFLGHVMFLKNQIPFPIVQLARMPSSDNTSRAAKRRHELLNSFDTLASHLYTTFVALSTALALRGTPEKVDVGSLRGRMHGAARAFFAVALGPTVGTAKTRVVVGIDGLETRLWGLRGDDSENGDDDDALENASNTDDEDEQNESEGEDEGVAGSDDDGSPPPSRSPSPSPSSDADESPSTSSLNAPSARTEDPEAVRAAERLLSRTLASACAEEDGEGLASEMAPTQIHVLLRAPRRFDHPSWIPRQNLCVTLDGCLSDFLEASGQPPADTTSKKRKKPSKVQGVWIKSCRGSVLTEDPEQDLAEEDELIWWSWDGKLAGFADW